MLQIILSAALSLFLACCALIYGLCRTWSFRKLSRLVRQQAQTPLPFVAELAGKANIPSHLRSARPAMSIIVATENDDWWVKRHLDPWLQQKTTFPFEVIVADASDNEDETRNIVQRYQNDYYNLRYTFVPQSHRNLHPRKLALTLGVRTARAPWVLVVTPDSVPISENWLERIKQQCTEDCDVVLGIVEATSEGEQRKAQFQSLEWQACNFRLWLKNTPATCDSTNVALRKSWVEAQGYFGESLEIPFGECALLVNHASPQRVALALHPDVVVQRPLPDEPLSQETAQREARTLHDCLAQRGVHLFRSKNAATFSYFIGLIAFLGVGVFRTFQSWPEANDWLNAKITPLPFVVYDYWQILWDGIPTLIFILLIIQPWCSRRTLKRLFAKATEAEV
jgi:hypothetical protein